jgi:serine protease
MNNSNNKNNLTGGFKWSKKSIAVSVALLSLSASNMVAASELIASAENTPMVFDVQNKIRAVDANKAIKNRYIVVLKDQYVAQQATMMSGMSSLNASPVSQAQAMSYRKQAVHNAAVDLAGMHNAKVNKRYHAALSGFVANMSRKDMLNLAADSRVEYVEQDQLMHANATQNNATWGLDRVDQADLPLNSTYNYTETGAGVTAYVVDTGVLASHSNFGGRVSGGYTAINDGRGTDDCNGHGTHVAGTIGSTTYGLAKSVSLVPVRVLDCNGSGSNSGVIAGVDWVAQNASFPAVANMSLGGGNSTALDNSVNNAINQGITFVVAAGNSNSDACSGSPNKVPNALTVASSTSSDARSSFSSWGSCIDIFAPGSNITSTWDNGGTNTISGTSMAAPHVAGAVALYLQSNPSASTSQVANAITSNAVSGRISNPNGSPNLLLQTTSGGTPPPPPPPPTGDELVNGVAVTGLSASTGNDIVYTMEVPAGATNITFSMSGGSGDADLYTRFGSAPTDSSYDCRPYRNGNSETCTGTQSGGTYYVRIKAYSSFSGVSITGSYTEPGTGGPTPVDSTVSNISVSSGAWQRYTLNLGSGYSNLNVAISGGSGDADLYVRRGSQSTTSSYDCRPYKYGNNETCAFTSPASDTWHIDIRGYTAASGVTLRVTAD